MNCIFSRFAWWPKNPADPIPVGEDIYFRHLSTPLGNMLAGVYKNALCLLEFREATEFQPAFEPIIRETGAALSELHHPLLDEVEKQLKDYFERRRKEFEVPLYLTGTPFQKEVWNYLLTLEWGKKITYKDQALKMQNLSAIRAIAHANALNKIAIVVPCHRVIGTNGKITGYAGGLERKRFLLELERTHTPGDGTLF